MDKKQDPEAAETAQITEIPAVALPQLVRLLPDYDMAWPESMQAQWFAWMSVLFREAEKQTYPLQVIPANGDSDRIRQLEDAIRWALGEHDHDGFRERCDNEGPYWWRKELRERAAAPSLPNSKL